MLRLTGVLVLTAGLALAQTPKFTTCVTNAQMRDYATVSDPQLSPNGKLAVWVQHESTADGAASHLWMAPVDGSAPARQITFSPSSDKFGESSPAWAPDGKAIYFTARRGKTHQLYRLPIAGGEAAPLALKTGKLELSPGRFEIAPDGKWLVFSARQPQTEQEKQEKKDKKDAVIVGQDRNPNRIWLYSFADQHVQALTPRSQEAEGFAWSPDSGQLAISLSPAENHAELPPSSKLEIVSLANPSEVRTLAGTPATIHAFSFSPNGQQIAYMAQSEHDTPPGVSDVYVIGTNGDAAHDLSGATPWAMSGYGGLVWKRDGSALYVEAQRHTRRALVTLAVNSDAPRWQPAATAMASGFSTNHRQTGWVFIAQSTGQMPQIVYAPTPQAKGTVLSHNNPDWAQTGWRAATPVSWQGPDNQTIHGLYYPPAACANGAPVIGGKSPMILRAHGGPTGAFTEGFDPFIQFLTAQGWAVLEINPRGSTGYGWQFTAADRNDLGGKDFQDEMAGLDWALAHEPVDAKRLGMFGYSYGGEMAGFIEGKSDRFAAIVAGAPVIDQYSEYGTERGWSYDRWFFGRPWQRPQDAWRQSGLSYAKNAKTPMLLLQGQADTTDPLGQSEEEYRALFEDGVPVRLVTFPGDDHGPLAQAIFGEPSHDPWHGYEGRTQILAWYHKYFRKAVGQ
ncbi:MAG: prolyl oligopeptidase family serine peptidase [Terriglobales bacterium]